MSTSLRWKLAGSYALLILLSVTLMGALALYFVQRYVESQEGEYLRANAKAVAEQAQRFLEPQLRRVALQNLAFTSAFLGDARVQILAADRSVYADSGDTARSDEFLWLIPSGLAEIETRPRTPTPFIFPMPQGFGSARSGSARELLPMFRDLPLGTSHMYARRMLSPWGRRFVFEEQAEGKAGSGPGALSRHLLTVTLAVGDARNPLGYVQMSSPLSLSSEAIGTMRNAVLFSGLGSLLIAVAFGLFMGKALSDPLRALATTARRMSEGDLAARAAVGRRDEIGALAGQFNTMATNLETSFLDLRAERDALKRFIADASHELRTPVTALATFNELLMGSASADPVAHQEFLKESQTQIQKLHWITANLLDLSRLDAGIASLTINAHNAADIVEAAAATLRARARDKGITLEVETAQGNLALSCDRNRVEMALTNLIGNAVKFASTGGTVQVRVAQEGAIVRFDVIDDGPGIAAEDLPLVFERFYRGREARSEGAGLGLAIVRSIARAHGGSISVESEQGKGSTFTLRIPARADARIARA
ncbi:MAG TPA: HAMP domain-containing sensor histidine kinase [Spirochaetia bacterium]|nr:HAMP domain-containing sensor histidine kinase [Spirochaetia bacterium]